MSGSGKRLPAPRACAVVFDLDGTLVDSLADLGESMNEVLAGLGLPEHPLSSYRHFVGDGIRMLVLRALPATPHSDEFVSEAVAKLRAVYGARWDRKTRPYAGIVEAVCHLAELRFRLGVLSNKPHLLTLRLVERFFPTTLFGEVMGAEAGFPCKPEPAGAIELARRLNVRAEACWYVGDTGTDMRTARSAGMFPIGALWGFRDADELLAAGAASLAERPADVVSIVTG